MLPALSHAARSCVRQSSCLDLDVRSQHPMGSWMSLVCIQHSTAKKGHLEVAVVSCCTEW